MSADKKNTIFAAMDSAPITPPEGLQLIGFPGKRENTGSSQLELTARCLLVGQNENCPQAAIIILDNLGFAQSLVKRIRNEVASCFSGLDCDAVMAGATHTHSAPALVSFCTDVDGKFPRANQDYIEQVVTTCKKLCADAWQKCRSVTISVGCGSAKLHHNRRVVGPDGKAHNEWLDENGTHNGVTNNDIPFVTFRDAESGELVWLLGSYACHPVTMGPENIKSCADYPGGFVKAITEATGAQDAMFITGAGADINPIDALTTDLNTPERVGKALAESVINSMDKAQEISPLPVKTNLQNLDIKISDSAIKYFQNLAQNSKTGKTLTTNTQAIRIGELAIVSAPGELFTELGQSIENLSPSPFTIVASYTNDYLGYLFTDKALAEGGYETNHPLSLDIEQPLTKAATKAIEQAFV